MAVNEIFFDRYPDSILEHQIQVRPFNALKTKNMRNLNPEGNVFNKKIHKQNLISLSRNFKRVGVCDSDDNGL